MDAIIAIFKEHGLIILERYGLWGIIAVVATIIILRKIRISIEYNGGVNDKWPILSFSPAASFLIDVPV